MAIDFERLQLREGEEFITSAMAHNEAGLSYVTHHGATPIQTGYELADGIRQGASPIFKDARVIESVYTTEGAPLVNTVAVVGRRREAAPTTSPTPKSPTPRRA